MLEQIPFLQNCEDEDSDEDDELDSVQHKKQRVRVSLPLLTFALALPGSRQCPIPPSHLWSCRLAQCPDPLSLPSFSQPAHPPKLNVFSSDSCFLFPYPEKGVKHGPQ